MKGFWSLSQLAQSSLVHTAGVTQMSVIVVCESSTETFPATFYLVGLSSARGFHLPAFLRDEEQQLLLLEKHCLLL